MRKKGKMKFHGNRYTVADGAKKSRADNKASEMSINCDSKRKLNQLLNETVEVDNSYNIIINFETLKSFSDLVVCPNFGKNKLNNNLEMSMAFIYELNLVCEDCEACSWSYRGYTSKYVEKEVIKRFPRQM